MVLAEHQAALSVLLRGYIATYWGPGSRESLFTSPVAMQQNWTHVGRLLSTMANNYVLTTTCDLERGGARKWNNSSETLVAAYN